MPTGSWCRAMTEQVPSKDQLCGECQMPIHPSDMVRHCGTYVTHTQGRCVSLLRAENVRWENAHKILMAENSRLLAELRAAHEPCGGCNGTKLVSVRMGDGSMDDRECPFCCPAQPPGDGA